MPAYFVAPVTTVMVNDVTQPARLDQYHTATGATPAEAWATLTNVDARSFDASTMRGKEARLKVDGTQILLGHVYGIRRRLNSFGVQLRLLDRRQLLNRYWGGYLHLPPNGVRVLGADIVFNLGGKPNKDIDTGIYLGSPVTPEFVYEKGNVSDPEDCATIESAYWTYGDILDWLWENGYIPDITKPTIPSFGGLDREAGEMSFFGEQTGVFLDRVFARTRCGFSMDGNGSIYIFDRENPRA